jgi:two-component system response regulator (stage 0 sporulation protein F)
MSEKKTILYVDDEKVNLMLFNYNYDKSFNVLTAISGRKGLDLLRSNTEIKILISDMKMPGMNGLELISAAKSEYPGIICILLTGYDITPEIREAINSKLIHRYFGKPFNAREMEDILNTLI